MKPIRLLGLFFLVALATTLVAQEQPPGEKDKKDKDEGDKAKDLIVRVAKNMKAAEERLKKTDPGDVTRKIQRDIVDDLEELIKQNSKSQSGGGKSSQKQQQKDSSNKGGADQQPHNTKDGQPQPKPGQQDENRQGKGKGKEDKDEAGQGKEKDRGEQGKGGKEKEDDKEGQAKGGGDNKDNKDDKKGQVKGMEGDKEGKDNIAGGLGNTKRDQDAKNKLNYAGDLDRSPWGHLPESKRLEMDAYSKERFMPRYDDLLRQYYRAIAEMSQKKDD